MILATYILAALWFFLPAGAANGLPVILSKLPVLRNWKAPLDGNKTWRGHPIFGHNKTWRGLIGGSLVAGLISLVQYLLLDYKLVGVPLVTSAGMGFAIGLLMGLGALIGDAAESFFKRQKGVKPGSAWFPFDQLDYIFGGLLLSYPLARPSWKIMIAVCITWFGVHLFSVYAGYLVGLRDKPI